MFPEEDRTDVTVDVAGDVVADGLLGVCSGAHGEQTTVPDKQ